MLVFFDAFKKLCERLCFVVLSLLQRIVLKKREHLAYLEDRAFVSRGKCIEKRGGSTREETWHIGLYKYFLHIYIIHMYIYFFMYISVLLFIDSSIYSLTYLFIHSLMYLCSVCVCAPHPSCGSRATPGCFSGGPSDVALRCAAVHVSMEGDQQPSSHT